MGDRYDGKMIDLSENEFDKVSDTEDAGTGYDQEYLEEEFREEEETDEMVIPELRDFDENDGEMDEGEIERRWNEIDIRAKSNAPLGYNDAKKSFWVIAAAIAVFLLIGVFSFGKFIGTVREGKRISEAREAERQALLDQIANAEQQGNNAKNITGDGSFELNNEFFNQIMGEEVESNGVYDIDLIYNVTGVIEHGDQKDICLFVHTDDGNLYHFVTVGDAGGGKLIVNGEEIPFVLIKYDEESDASLCLADFSHTKNKPIAATITEKGFNEENRVYDSFSKEAPKAIEKETEIGEHTTGSVLFDNSNNVIGMIADQYNILFGVDIIELLKENGVDVTNPTEFETGYLGFYTIDTEASLSSMSEFISIDDIIDEVNNEVDGFAEALPGSKFILGYLGDAEQQNVELASSDIIISIDGIPCKNSDKILENLAKKRIGEIVQIEAVSLFNQNAETVQINTLNALVLPRDKDAEQEVKYALFDSQKADENEKAVLSTLQIF